MTLKQINEQQHPTTMNTTNNIPDTLVREYRKARTHKPFMISGQDAAASLDAARTILRFRELESLGLVRIRAEHEQGSYFDVYGEPDTQREREAVIDAIDRNGLSWVTTEVRRTCERCEDEQWEHADSAGMCIYADPCDPYDNPYVVDLMRAAIDKVDELTKEATGRQ